MIKIHTLNGWYPDIDDIIVIDGDLLSFKRGKDSFMSKYVHLTLISNILSHTSSSLSRTGPACGFTAALETKISRPPNIDFV